MLCQLSQGQQSIVGGCDDVIILGREHGDSEPVCLRELLLRQM